MGGRGAWLRPPNPHRGTVLAFVADALELAISIVTGRRLQEQGQPLTSDRVVEWLTGGAGSAAGVPVSVESALQLSAVYDCVRLIAEDVGALPLHLYQRVGDGKERAVTLPLYRLLHDVANPHMTAMQFRETMQAHLLLRGNAYANIERNGTGIVALWPLRPDRMQVRLAEAGTLMYTYTLPDGSQTVFSQTDILHLRGLSFDGIMGISPIGMQRDVIGYGLAAQEYGAKFLANNANPSGVLQAKTKLSPEAATRLATEWNRLHSGTQNAYRAAVLEEGLEWKQVSISPEDSQYLESRKFSRSEIAGMFRVPPHMIGDLERATFSNIEEQAIQYVTDTLQAWLVRWEQQINKDLLLPSQQGTLFVEHLVDAKLRGKTLERYQAYEAAWWMTPNEKRSRENLNPLPGLDEPFVPTNNVTPMSKIPDPGPVGAAVASS